MKKIGFAVLCLLLSGSFIFSQVTGLPTLQKEFGLEEQMKSQIQQQLLSEKETYPTTTLVVDTFYYVGPGDIFSILILPISVNPEVTKVSTDGQLILSRYGFIDVKGKTLLEVKNSVTELVKNINPNAEVPFHFTSQEYAL